MLSVPLAGVLGTSCPVVSNETIRMRLLPPSTNAAVHGLVGSFLLSASDLPPDTVAKCCRKLEHENTEKNSKAKDAEAVSQSRSQVGQAD